MRCHINTAVFLETSVFGQENLVFPLRKGGFHIVHLPDVVNVPSVLQRFNTFINSSADTSVCCTTFPRFKVLIAVTHVESWSRAKWLCSNCNGTVGELER